VTSPGTRRLHVVAGAIVGLALLTGCAPEVDPGWTPPAWEDAPVTVVPAPEPLNATVATNLVGERIRNDTVGVQARWMRLPGDSALGEATARIVRDAVAARGAAIGVAYAPAVFPQGAGLGARSCVRGSTLRPASEILADPAIGPAAGTGTAVACDIVSAAGTVVGERIRVVTGTPEAVGADTQTLLYADTASGRTVTATQLWTDAASATLWDDTVEAIRRSAGALSLVADRPPSPEELALGTAALAETVPAPDGSLRVTLPAGFTAPELEQLGIPATNEPMTIAVPPAVSAPLLTEFGAQLVASASAPFQAPAPVAAGFETVDCDLLPCVAMTYDDGPSDGTPAILDAAAAHHASVTFFAMGQKAAGYAAVMTRALAEGNLVENHTWSHPHLSELTRAEVAKQVGDTTSAIGLATGQAPTVFRPPYGDSTPQVLSAAGMAAILWDVDTFD